MAGSALRTRVASLAAVVSLLLAITPQSPPAAVAAEPAPPNFVLVLTDDQSIETLSRDPATMPWLQRRLGGSGPWISFSNAYVNSPMCCPSRATVLTGRYAHRHGVTNNDVSEAFDDTSTLATWLDAAGYRTGLVGKYLNGYPWDRGSTYVPPGWDRWVGWLGPVGKPYYDYDLNVDGAVVHHGAEAQDYSTDVYLEHALDFLATPSDEPFFLHFSPGAPHSPWRRAPRHSTAWKAGPAYRAPSFNEADVSDKPAWVRDRAQLTPRQVDVQDRHRRDQNGTLRAVDEALKAIVGALADAGELADTVILFMSDNGYAFGEKRWVGKGCPYDQCAHVPFVARVPGAVGRTESVLVSNVDVAPTIAELARISPGGEVDGVSLVPVFDDAPVAWRDELLVEWGGGVRLTAPPFWELRTRDYVYVEYPRTGEAELYDLTGQLGPADPDELVNVCPGAPPACSSAEYEAVRADLAARLAALHD